ncbi:MAG: hypothetical protein K5894_09305 [Lachnospiraceae bacterium]|nr:hypothetical protein [Lachnospiraceae bacterium]
MAEAFEPTRELADQELENISGGAKMYDPGFFYEMRFKFSDKDAKKLRNNGYKVKSGVVYSRGYLNTLGLYGSTGGEMARGLKEYGISVKTVDHMKGWSNAK